MNYSYTPSTEECKAIFIASCIESAAGELNMSPEDVYKRMLRVNLIRDYIVPCYGVLHAESRRNITADIIKTMRIWEEKKGIRV